MAKTLAVGIDLGTTYSAVAYLDDKDRTQIVRNTEGDLLTPSAVLFENTEVIVGKEAKKASAVRSESVAQFVKRDMGKKSFSHTIHGEQLHPEVIQACILKKLKDDAIASLGKNFEVVITVPAYFDEPRRKATADAGEMAGLAVLDIVNEPTAAALSFGETLGYLTAEGEPREPMKVLVYDLGGGTFDVTILDLRPGDLRTLATDGDVQLGGYDWDMRLVNFAAEEFQKQYRLDPRESPAALAALQAAAEEAKHTLTARPKTTLMVRHGGHSLELTVTREQFEELTEDLLERTAYTTRQVLAATGLSWPQINRVLLVGGSTRMPMVQRMIEQLSGQKPDHTVHPDEAVARGAAIFAGYLLRHRDPNAKPSFKVVDVNAHSLGIEGIDQRTMRKENVVLIKRNSPLPAKVTEKFVTKTEDQISIVVAVLEGESKVPSQCSMIGRAVLRHLPEHLPKGWPVEVTYEYLTNGRLDVHAKIPGTSRQVELELQREQSLTSERVGRWKKIVEEAKGFDAFDDMLDDVANAHRIEKRKDPLSPSIPTKAAMPGPARSIATASATSPPAPVSPSRDLSGASRAFGAFADALDEPAKSPASTGAATQFAALPSSKAGAKPEAPPTERTKPEPAAKASPARLPVQKKPLTLMEAAAAKAGASMGSTATLAGAARAEAAAEATPRRTPRSLSPGMRWLMSIAAFLIVSVFSLLVCYYVLAKYGHMGNFLNLPLPWLPPPKAAPATMSNGAMSNVAQSIGQWLARWS
jgi:molecular chaperone DnaK